MIPYFEYHTIPIGPLQLQVWGMFVAAGILVATALAARIARKEGLNPSVIYDIAVWAVVPAFIMGRLVHVVIYDLSSYLSNPISILYVWQGGASSFGGFLGALIGIWFYTKKRTGLRETFWKYVEIGAYTAPLGYGIGRLGCFFIHDHPGVLSDSILAVNFPSGARLDHGLLLSIVGFAIFAIFFFVRRRYGSILQFQVFLPLLLILYGLARFVLDFYRAYDLPFSDIRYYALTPAQYGSIIFVVLGVKIGYHTYKRIQHK